MSFHGMTEDEFKKNLEQMRDNGVEAMRMLGEKYRLLPHGRIVRRNQLVDDNAINPILR